MGAMPIFSCLALSFFDLVKHGIEGVSCVGEFHFHLHDRERLQSGEIWAKIDGVFFGGDEATGLAAVFELK
jgi:hypothetical protein